MTLIHLAHRTPTRGAAPATVRNRRRVLSTRAPLNQCHGFSYPSTNVPDHVLRMNR